MLVVVTSTPFCFQRNSIGLLHVKHSSRQDRQRWNRRRTLLLPVLARATVWRGFPGYANSVLSFLVVPALGSARASRFLLPLLLLLLVPARHFHVHVLVDAYIPVIPIFCPRCCPLLLRRVVWRGFSLCAPARPVPVTALCLAVVAATHYPHLPRH